MAVPVGYLLLALACFVVLLPSALRPPPDQANAAAEFSPDAPPDENQDSIVAALSRGTSGTAGTGQGVGDGNVTPEGVPAIIEEQAPKACPRGFGDPPRQTESLYSAPCAKAFTGDNGGATYQGVTADEIRIALMFADGQGGMGAFGEVKSEPPPGENAQQRTWRVLAQYFNQNYQFYGRTLRFYGMDWPTGDAEQRAEAARADQEYGVFGSVTNNGTPCDEFVRRRLTTFCGTLPREYFTNRAPYAWAWFLDSTTSMEFTGEYLCKKLVGKPPQFNERADPTFDYDAPRKFGLLTLEDENYRHADNARRALAEECGAKYDEVVVYGLDADTAGYAATAVTRLRQAGVTTVVIVTDYLTGGAVVNQADSQGYSPEWFVPSFGGNDRNQLGQFMNPKQWRHAFGFSGFEVERNNDATDCYRAYHSIEPNSDPHYGACTWMWGNAMQFVNGIQAAGPNLNPDTFAAGLHKLGKRFYYDTAPWAVGGGFAPGDPTYIDDVTETWWDVAAVDPQNGNRVGAWRYVRNGKRYRLGELPREDSLVFKDGVTTLDE